MILKKLFKLAAIFSVLALCLGALCEDDDNGNGPTDPCAGTTELTLVEPNGGETLSAGEAVEIKWCYPDPWDYGKIRIFATTDNGLSFPEIATEGATAGYPIPHPGTSFSWTIPADFAGKQVILKVEDYDGYVNDFSDAFFTVQ